MHITYEELVGETLLIKSEPQIINFSISFLYEIIKSCEKK